ncbi:MAG: hypothetical protein A3J54_00250 [Candidatus Ryanbacteria bacterium RIFCSPHIGHO2_02_FULL_45_13b]|uniref:Ada DNA repair metal-binding domain-containing protein n=1 Tax=Candidatus Ryanbacteria bacterium RIFCSPHIGHO2_02_FULL_45_13b TaxID=1802117 RepID=A0A1G2G9K6_9BACT|nr:MAG: hypothetical protein A3J54_00250 [Candidatus Ryanbacteria bacterium RIFCSPHIGHO2_02_FULL_45_13b]
MLQRIAKLIENSKEWWKGDKEGFFWTGGVFLVILLAGGIFRLLVLWQDWSPIALTHEGEQTGFVSKEKLIQEYMTASGLPGLVAASRNGKRYYYQWCAGLNRIKEANKIWFDSIKSAEAAGYTIASGCEGL